MSELRDVAEAMKHHAALWEEAKATVSRIPVDTTCSAQDALQQEIHSGLKAAIDELVADSNYDPVTVARRGLAALSQVEAKAFLVQNVLESVKSGRSLTDTMTTYYKIGLTETNPEELKPTADGTQPRNGSFVRRILGAIKKLMGVIANMIASAISCGGKMVGIKPSVGFAAGFPTLSFAIEAESANFTELWTTLKAAFIDE